MRGVKFGPYHSYDNFGLYLAAYPVVSTPEPQTTLVTIPGRDGTLDLTEALDGTVHFSDRTMTFRFLSTVRRTAWPTLYKRIQNALHGRRMDIILDDDREYYYTGRVEVKPPSYAKRDFAIEISASVHPYKMGIETTGDQWKWDPFNFQTGIIRDYGHMSVNGSLSVGVDGFTLPVRPSVTVHSASGMSVSVGGKTYQLPGGTTTQLDFEVVSGRTVWTFSGTGMVSIIMRERSL